MSWTAPRDWVAGEVLTGALMNTFLRDEFKALTEWTTVPFNSLNFTASSGTWGVTSVANVPNNKYLAAGKRIDWQLNLNGTTITGAPSSLRVQIPTGVFATIANYARVAFLNDSGVVREALARPIDGTHLEIVRVDGGAFTPGALFALAFQGTFELL